jgi:cytochrome oxidase Cu insertion factor (SCO1/SenC/PrrC family)
MRAREPANRRRLLGVGVAAVAVLAVVLTVVASRGPSSVSPAASSAREDTSGSFAPLRLTSLDGKQIALPTGRPGMVMFSTSICVTCFVAARGMAQYRSDAPRRVDAAFVSVDPGDSARALAERRAAIGRASYPFAIDTSGTLAARYRITVLGTVIVYDATGRIVARIVEPGPDDLRAAFNRAGVA